MPNSMRPLCLQDFKDGKVDTAFIPKHEDELQAVRPFSSLTNLNTTARS